MDLRFEEFGLYLVKWQPYQNNNLLKQLFDFEIALHISVPRML